jgi:hypothetical protein
MADPARVRALVRAPNARVILRHKKTIAEIQLLNYADESHMPSRWGNPQALTTKGEDFDNPPRVLKFKRLVDQPTLGPPSGSS